MSGWWRFEEEEKLKEMSIKGEKNEMEEEDEKILTNEKKKKIWCWEKMRKKFKNKENSRKE